MLRTRLLLGGRSELLVARGSRRAVFKENEVMYVKPLESIILKVNMNCCSAVVGTKLCRAGLPQLMHGKDGM